MNNKKLFLIILLSSFLIFGLSINKAIWAQTESATPTEKESTSSADIQENVDSVRKEIEKKVAEKLDKITTQKRGYFGKISDLFNKTVVLTLRTQDLTVKINEETEIVNISRQKVNFDGLEIGSWVIVLGELDQEGVLTAKRVVGIKNPEESPSREALLVKVTEVGEKSLKVEKNDGSTLTVSIDKKTKISRKNDEKAIIKDISAGDKIIVIGTSKKEGEILAKIIFLFGSIKKSTPSPTSTPESTE